MSGKPSPCATLATWWEIIPRADGKPGKRTRLCHAWYTPLRACQLCGLLGTPKRVQYRSRCHAITDGRAVLCMGCWNRIRPLAALQSAIGELQSLQRKLLREARNHGDIHR